MDTPDARVMAALPRLRRLAHALVCEPDRADELVRELVESAITDTAQLPAEWNNDLQLIRRLRRLWINRLEEWQAALPLDHTDEAARAMHAMASLPRSQREAVALVVVDQLDYRDAADIAGVSRVTLAERLVSGRKALAALLATTPA